MCNRASWLFFGFQYPIFSFFLDASFLRAVRHFNSANTLTFSASLSLLLLWKCIFFISTHSPLFLLPCSLSLFCLHLMCPFILPQMALRNCKWKPWKNNTFRQVFGYICCCCSPVATSWVLTAINSVALVAMNIRHLKCVTVINLLWAFKCLS